MNGQIAIVTGGAKGIGRHVARTFSQAGAHVAIADMDQEALQRTEADLQAIDPQALGVRVDVREEDDVRQLMQRVADHFGRIDILVNNAGIVPHFNWGVPRWPRIRDMEPDFWGRVMATNLGGTFLCTKHVLPYLEEQSSGHVLNLHGGGGDRACAYVVTKDAIRTFTRFVADEERPWNVCVICVSPGNAIATEDAPEEARRRLPGPETLEQHFLLAAQASMEWTGKLVTVKDGSLAVDSAQP